MLSGMLLEPVGGHDTDPFAAQDVPMRAWIVGDSNYEKWTPGWAAWQFVGMFDSEGKAVAVCKTKTHFVAPCTMNEVVPNDGTVLPGSYYPLAEVKGEQHGESV